MGGSVFARTDAPTQTLPTVPAPRPSSSVPPLHRDPSTNPDLVALNMIRVCSQAMAEHWSATRLHKALESHNEELEKRWRRELDGGRKVAARRAAAEAQAERLAHAIEAAVLVEETTGAQVPLDPEALGRGLAAMAANAHALAESTMSFRAITEGMPDPRVETVPATASADPASVPSLARKGAAPVPGEGELVDTGTHEPLPHRDGHPEITVLPAACDEDGDPSDPMHRVRPVRARLNGGEWVLDEGTGSAGRAWWLVARQRDVIREQGPAAVLEFANGHKRELSGADQVWVLSENRAAELLAEVEARQAVAR